MDASALAPDPVEAALRFLTSLGIGLMMGLERERRPGSNAGLRTFSMVALMGTVCGLLAERANAGWLLPAGLLGLALMMIAADQHRADPDGAPDVTTSVAVLLCFVLGAMAWYGHPQLAVAVALLATALLHFKTELHGFTRRMTRHDVVSILQFAAITGVVLPLLPDAGYGPYGVLNPYRIWLVVVVTSGVSLVGYTALRVAPSIQAVPLLGILGGAVSSTATTVVFARHMRRDSQSAEAGLGVILIANLVVLIRMTLITAVLAPSLLWQIGSVLMAGLFAGLAGSVRDWARLLRKRAPVPELRNPVGLRDGLGFAVLFALVMVAGAWLHEDAGIRGVYGLAAVSGLFDIDAITVSTLEMQLRGSIGADPAARALVLAFGVNLLMKLVLLRVLGGRTGVLKVARQGVATMLGLGAALILA